MRRWSGYAGATTGRGPLTGGERKLPRKVRQRLERGAHLLVHLCARLRGQLGQVLDLRERGVRVELSRAEPLCSGLEPLGELDEGIGHLSEGSGRAPRT